MRVQRWSARGVDDGGKGIVVAAPVFELCEVVFGLT